MELKMRFYCERATGVWGRGKVGFACSVPIPGEVDFECTDSVCGSEGFRYRLH